MNLYSELIDEATPIGLTFYSSSITKKGGAPAGAKQHREFDTFEELAAFFTQEPRSKRVKRRVPLFTRATCEGRRLKENLKGPLLVILDFDKVPKTLGKVSRRLAFFGVDHIGYTTHSHEGGEKNSFRIITDHYVKTWGELRDVIEQAFALCGTEPTPESWTSPGWFVPATHPDRDMEYRYREHLTGGSTWHPERKGADEYNKPKKKAKRRNDDLDIPEVESALEAIPNDDLHYDDWLEIGMALHDTGSDDALLLWEEWSAKSAKHDADYCAQKWDTFSEGRENAVTLGTVFHYATAHGWKGHVDKTPTASQDFDNYVRPSARESEDEEDEEPQLEVDPEVEAVADLVRWKAQLEGVNHRSALRHMNDRFGYVLGTGAVLDTDSANDDVSFHSVPNFQNYFIHPMFPHPTKTDKNNNPVEESLGKSWFLWKGRREYSRVDFLPPGGPNRLGPDVFNRWRGWGVEPEEGTGHERFLEHAFENVCSGNDEWFRWVVAWLAHLVQRPWEKVGTALVLRSSIEGTGKGVFGSTVLKLAGAHGAKVDHAERLTGRFNAHFFGKVFIFADEVTWGGNKKDAGVLRSLITEEISQYEEKLVPAWNAQSFSRLFLTGNDEWLVPVSSSARRYQIFNVNPTHARDRVYFGRLLADLRRGGYESLIHFLLSVDLDDYPDPANILGTDALMEQRVESLGSVDSWLYESLMNGCFSMSANWPDGKVAKRALFDDYLGHSKDNGERRQAVESKVGSRLRKVFGATVQIKRLREGDGERVRYYTLPTLEEARKMFTSVVVQDAEWPEEEEI